MKNVIIKLSLIAAMVVACNTAMAVFTDNSELQVLMHCDETDQDYWLTTPDDNSSGRAANECILDMIIGGTTVDPDTQPIMMPDSPKGGEYFAFDGINDSIVCEPGWLGGDTVVCDFSFRSNTLPESGDYDGLVSCSTFTCFLWNNGGGTGPSYPCISVMLLRSIMIFSPIELEADTWYDIQVRIVNDDVSITVDGSTYTEHSDFPLPTYTSAMTIGYFLLDNNYFLDGDMDEIRIGNLPEPFTFGLIGLLGFFIIRRKK